jgi:hypothetical protein
MFVENVWEKAAALKQARFLCTKSLFLVGEQFATGFFF